MLRIGDAAKQLGVHTQTLRRWEKEGKIKCKRTAKGQRRYERDEIEKFKGDSETEKSEIIYCRGKDVEYMRKIFPDYGVITDEASSITAERYGLQTILERICKKSIRKVAIKNKETIGYGSGEQIFEKVAKIHGCEIIIVNNEHRTGREEIIEELELFTTSLRQTDNELCTIGQES